MSGRGRNSPFSRGTGRGAGRSHSKGRGNKSSPKTNNNNKSNNNNNQEIKFVPHYSGKQQTVTYDTMRDHIETHIQKTVKYGNDMVKAIRNMSYTPSPIGSAPVRQLVVVPTGSTLTTMMQWELQQEQDRYNIEYTEQIKLHNLRKRNI